MEVVPSSDIDDSESDSEMIVQLDFNLGASDEDNMLDTEENESISDPRSPPEHDNVSVNDMDSSSDELNPDPLHHVQPDPQDSNSDSDLDNDIHDNLAIDLDNLLQDDCSSDEMFDILNGDPEWTDSEFADIHVRHFIGPTGFNLPPYFDVEVASAIDYFQLFFSDDVFQTICDNTNKFQ